MLNSQFSQTGLFAIQIFANDKVRLIFYNIFLVVKTTLNRINGQTEWLNFALVSK